MGNQLVGAAPAQIFPVEHYMSDIADLNFDTSLGSTRFLKVARARHHQAGLVVVKVFTIQDAGLALKKDRDKLVEIKRTLETCVNCLPFQRAFLSERAGFIVRQYVKDSLYDRISTRPFLTLVEKKWIAFQLLLALQQAHKHGVCHGDIKMENVMVTSWNWVLLTDFASFKPTFLPEDNPADYSYFFDTSRRRTCYIAPERFKTRTISMPPTDPDPVAANNMSQFLPEAAAEAAELASGELVPSMDIFSAGCVLIELFTEATPPFHFSQLLAYRAGEYEPSKVLDKIEDGDVRELVMHMIQKDPLLRKSANEYLMSERGKSFPEYFYTFFQTYMQIFSTDPSMLPDQKIAKIHENQDSLLEKLNEPEGDFDEQGLTLICTLVTSNVRSLKFCGAKIKAMDILGKLAEHVSSETILDRILPYVITLLSDKFPSVRIAAFVCLSKCVRSVHTVPLSDANIFPEYILPNLLPLCHDRNELVRSAFAASIAEIAQESVRFLDLVMLGGGGTVSSDRPLLSYDAELVALHDLISQAVSVLLADSVNSVKQALMEHSVTKLAVFFGKLKANDVLLSHMITFLNDKDDAQLRIAFYQNIVGVAAFVGWQCSPILLPLLQQGLSDPEESVVATCIHTMSCLTGQQLLQKVALYELLKETTPYLLHPNLWIRQATARFVASAATTLDAVDVLVKLGTIVAPYLKHTVVQLDQPALLLAHVDSPVPRLVFEDVIKTQADTLSDILDLLEERQTARHMSKTNLQVLYSEMPGHIKPLFRRLSSEGMTPSVEDKLLHMKDNLIKISRHKSSVNNKHDEGGISGGNVDLAKCRVTKRTVPLNSDVEKKEEEVVKAQSASPALSTTSSPRLGHNRKMSATLLQPSPQSLSPCPSPTMNRRSNRASPMPENVSQKKNFSPCKVELEEAISKKRCEFAINTRKRMTIEQGLSDRNFPPSGWRPKGVLVAHLHEHQGGITKLIRLPDKPIFASAAADGCVRLWDCSKFEGSNLANKAHRMFSHHSGSPLNSLAVSADGETLASGAENGTICIYRTDTQTVSYHRKVSVDDEGPPVEFCFRETGSSPLLVYGTAFGSIVGWDLRCSGTVFRLENDLLDGLQTTLAMSPDQNWAVCGTSSGVIKSWDLRFQLSIVKCTHPSEARIRQIVVPSGSSGEVLAAVQGNNEVGLWNMESQFRQLVLWASSSPLLSASQSSSQSISAMHSIQTHDTNVVITSGTDMRIRYWNLQAPEKSYIVAGGSSEKINLSAVSYRSKLVDGTEVVQEVHAKPKNMLPTGQPSGGAFDDVNGNKPGLDGPAQGHLDWISGLTLCQASRWYVVSGSKDGVIKVWK